MGHSAQTISFDGLEFDSWEEIHVYWHLMELYNAGYVYKIFREPQTYELLAPLYIDRRLKGKSSTSRVELMPGTKYTPDFGVIWTASAPTCIHQDINKVIEGSTKAVPYYSADNVSIIEVKGDFDKHGGTREFEVKRKLMWDKHQAYVNLVRPIQLYKKSFTPDRYLYTDKLGILRTIHHETRTLDAYVKKNSRLQQQLKI